MGLSLSDRQHVVDHEDALFGPSFEVPVARNGRKAGNIRIVHEFLVNIAEGWRGLDAPADRKTNPVSLVGPVIWVLPNDHELGFGQRAEVQRGKGVLGRWIYRVLFSST